MQASDFCPECGAPRVDGMDCWEQMGAICAWEWQDLALAALHFVTVASYNLQHPAMFTERASAEMRQAFIDHLAGGAPVAEIRQRLGHSFAGQAKVIKPVGERQPVLRNWTMTIAAVYLPDQPTGAAQRVRAWAASIRAELA